MKKIILFVTIVSIVACKRIFCPDDDFNIQKKDYVGNALIFNGFYYYTADGRSFRYSLYTNGIVRELGRGDSLNDDNFFPRDDEDSWGLFEINNQTIKLEMLASPGGGQLYSYTKEGMILNDTTFQMTESYRLKKGKKTEYKIIDRLYHFYQYSPKPDSTNDFIK
ncbi:MAG: hypothetical protein ACJA0Q_000836 [Saprospiraceae bacterium]|jgi:hypothetical protein